MAKRLIDAFVPSPYRLTEPPTRPMTGSVARKELSGKLWQAFLHANQGLPFQFNMVVRKQTLHQIPDMLRIATEYGSDAVEIFDLVLAGRAKVECQDQALSVEERREVMEWLAETQREYPIVIRVPACPMYPVILKRKNIQPKYVPMQILARIPYYGRGCAAGMPFGYLVIRANGELNACMPLQVDIGNAKRDDIRDVWQNSPILAELRDRDLLKGDCGKCEHKQACAGCRGRAYEESGDLLASDPGCWLAQQAAAT